ncbi:MAG: hypothetical protein J4G09_02860 [Proteobacteria bacterium]|nr:hypothetical protein [Pseudomonadota bacterium]
MPPRGGRALRRAALLAGGLALLACGLREIPEDARWRASAEALRGLEFDSAVRIVAVDRSDVPALVRRELGAWRDPEFARRVRDAYAALGAWPAQLDPVSAVLELQGARLAGLYSPRRRELYMVGEPEDWNESVVVHELVHALQHRHFPRPIELLQGLRHNDDAAAALAAAAEGDATLTMLRVQRGPSAHLPEDRVEAYRAALRRDVEAPPGEFGKLPRLLRETLAFPYAEGLAQADRRFRSGGTSALNALLREPPLSSLEVLDPEAGRSVEFVGLPLDWLQGRVDAACRVGHHNVAGALGLRSLLADHGRSAPGLPLAWRGDRFVHLDCSGRWEFVWLSRWSDAEAAERFAAHYAQIGAAVARSTPVASAPRPWREGRTLVLASAGVRELVPELIERTLLRSFDDFSAWVAADCFPESPCP